MPKKSKREQIGEQSVSQITMDGKDGEKDSSLICKVNEIVVILTFGLMMLLFFSEYQNRDQMKSIQMKRITQNEETYYIQQLNDKLIEFYQREKATSIVDFYCGLCNYAINLKEAGFQVEAYDNNPYVSELTKGFADTIDLTTKQRLPKQYDWVQSFDIADRIKKDEIIEYVENIARHAKKGAIISWQNQKNEEIAKNKLNKKIIELFSIQNFVMDTSTSKQFRKIADIEAANDFMVFRRVQKQSKKQQPIEQQESEKKKAQRQEKYKQWQKQKQQEQKSKLEQAERQRQQKERLEQIQKQKSLQPPINKAQKTIKDVDNVLIAPSEVDKPKIKSVEVEQISKQLQFLQEKLFCQDILLVRNSQNVKQGQISINDIISWVTTQHSFDDTLSTQEKAIHKCGIIQTADMRPDFVMYKGFQYLVFQSTRGSDLINRINQQIAVRRLGELVKVSWETANSKKYAVIQFYHPVLPNSKGYYNGNQQNRIKKEHGYFIQNWNDKLIEFYKRENATSIVDLGCGLCTYAMNIKEAGFEVDGYDGNPYTPQLTKGFAKTIDLTEPQRLPKKYDWVQSFEVGEHIPKDKTIIFVENIVRHATKGVLLSWGIIGQQGYYHINNKSNKEVIQMMKGYGLEHDPVVSKQFRSLNLKDAQYFQKSFMAFRKV